MNEITIHEIPDFVWFDFQANLVVTVLNFWRVRLVNRIDPVADRHDLRVITEIESVIDDPSVAKITFSPRPQPGITRHFKFTRQWILEVQVTRVRAAKVCNLAVMSDPPHGQGSGSLGPGADDARSGPVFEVRIPRFMIHPFGRFRPDSRRVIFTSPDCHQQLVLKASCLIHKLQGEFPADRTKVLVGNRSMCQ